MFFIFIRSSQTRAYHGMALSVRPSVVFRLTRAQVHISLRINLLLSIRVYDYKTLNEFHNHHDPIQSGCRAAILFFSVDTRSSPHFSTNQPRLLHRFISIPTLNEFETTVIKFKMATHRPCW